MDVDDCKRGYRVGFKPKGIVHEKARMVSFNAIRQGLFNGLREALPESGVDYYELAAAVLAPMSEDAAGRWLAGERIFAGAELTLESPAQASGVDEEASSGEV